MEEDEAGRLKRFRRRFGRGFDVEALESGEEVSASIVSKRLNRAGFDIYDRREMVRRA